MKHILMRMGMSPFDNDDLLKVVNKDTIGTNTGNMLFPYSIMRTIWDKDVKIDSYRIANEKDADMINERYDMFIIPLANAFRESFKQELVNLTALIQKLRIPCVVVGVGMQTSFEPKEKEKHTYDKVVYDFVSAVLEKSASIGVRGEITKKYLKNLGFSDNNIEVIGCPSMFMYGSFLPLKKSTPLTKDSRITMNYHGNFPEYFEFLERCKREFHDYYLILQGINDLRLLYAGHKINDDSKHALYIKDIDAYTYRENKLRSFINVPSWISFLSKADVGIGSCIHGSIASVLAGNPTIVFAADSRVRELAEYHDLVMYPITNINKNTDLYEIYEKADFSKVLIRHKSRYETYIKFLNRNDISCHRTERIQNEFDKEINKMNLHEPEGVGCYTALPYEQQVEQLKNYLRIAEGKLNWWKKQGNRGEVWVQYWQDAKECTLKHLDSMK